MLTLISKNTIQQYINLSPSSPPESQKCNPLGEVDQKVKKMAKPQLEFYENQDGKTLRSLFDDGGNLNIPPGLEKLNDRVKMDAILKKLKLQQDGHDKILVDMLNRWEISTKIPLLFLFWMDTNNQLQALKKQIPARKVDADVLLKNVSNKIAFLFFNAFQTFGLDLEEMSMAPWLKAEYICSSFEIEMSGLKTIIDHEKCIENSNDPTMTGNQRGNRGKPAQRNERRLALLSKKNSPC